MDQECGSPSKDAPITDNGCGSPSKEAPITDNGCGYPSKEAPITDKGCDSPSMETPITDKGCVTSPQDMSITSAGSSLPTTKEVLCDHIHTIVQTMTPAHADKITGMLADCSNEQLLTLLQDQTLLKHRVQAALMAIHR